jgi:hypothetical protein
MNEPPRPNCDNESAISIAHNPIQHDRTKHIKVDKHFIKEKLNSGLNLHTICLYLFPKQPCISTKGLNNNNSKWIVSNMRMIDIYSPA